MVRVNYHVSVEMQTWCSTNEIAFNRNHRTIRDYLIHGFPGFQLTEDAPDPTISHRLR